MTTVVGALGSAVRASVDERGRVASSPSGLEIDWWIGAEDRRHHPAREPAVRQRRLGVAPAVETAMRVPGGDAVQRVYGVPEAVVIEIENASALPFAVGLVARHASRRRDVALQLPRPPSREESSPEGRAVVYPVPHRTRLRFAVGRRDIDLATQATVDDVARGWDAQLRRGMRVDLPDAALQAAVDAARADALLAGDAVDVLEDWGFDDEAATAWHGLGWRGRRRDRRRRGDPGRWQEVADASDGVELLRALRRLLAHEVAGEVTLLTEPPEPWRGQSVDVRDAPTRSGRVSYAVRWHGERPALLWECDGTTALRTGLDPGWSTSEPRGEALLAAARFA